MPVLTIIGDNIAQISRELLKTHAIQFIVFFLLLEKIDVFVLQEIISVQGIRIFL